MRYLALQDRQGGPSPAQLSLAAAAPGLLDDIALARLRLQRISEQAQVTPWHLEILMCFDIRFVKLLQ